MWTQPPLPWGPCLSLHSEHKSKLRNWRVNENEENGEKQPRGKPKCLLIDLASPLTRLISQRGNRGSEALRGPVAQVGRTHSGHTSRAPTCPPPVGPQPGGASRVPRPGPCVLVSALVCSFRGANRPRPWAPHSHPNSGASTEDSARQHGAVRGGAAGTGQGWAGEDIPLHAEGHFGKGVSL